MIKFIEFELTTGTAVLVQVAKITAVIPNGDVNNTKIFMQGDNSGDYIGVRATYQQVKDMINLALSN